MVWRCTDLQRPRVGDGSVSRGHHQAPPADLPHRGPQSPCEELAERSVLAQLVLALRPGLSDQLLISQSLLHCTVYLLHPVAAENIHKMTNCTGGGNCVAASQPQPLEREARGRREYRRRPGEALAEAGPGGPLSLPGERRRERSRRAEVARTTPS